ncbi:DUF4270 family protein [Thalassobellus citreus]|uniref:DUF4270 family protein n=1 Tax=Thalassobellus citreus TaxID=3367752 RepID=UPI0037A96061
MTLKQVIAVPIITFLLLASILSCETDNNGFPVGEDWINLDTKVYFIDTLSIENTTFKFDSLITSNTNRLLIGLYNDPVFGITKSKSYVQLLNSTYGLADDAVFDSVALILNYDHYFYNDTIPVQKINIYEVLDDIEPDDETNSFYNTTNFNYNTTPLASKSFIAKPKKDDSLHVSISNTFGKDIFDKIQLNTINNSDEFLKEYKGLVIEPDDNNTTVLGFSNTSFLRIYYSFENDELEDGEKTIDLPFNSSYSFHNISSNKQGTVFESLPDQETLLPSTITDNNSFLQAGTGIATRINIPNIESIYDIDGDGIIIDANLKISIKQNSSTKNLHTNDSLNVYIINRKAEILSPLTDTQGNTVLGRIVNEDSEFNIIDYSIPVKYFLNLKLTDINADNLFLAIYPKDFNSSVNRYILNGEEASQNIKSKLELTYAIYD